jgi:flavodoxin
MKVTAMAASGKVLVVYYSLSGNTARVALDLARRLGADIESLRDKNHGAEFAGFLRAAYDAWRRIPSSVENLGRDPGNYDLTIIGTPVWVGQMTPAVRSYLRQTHGRCDRVGFFVTSGNTDVTKVLRSFEAEAKQAAAASVGFNQGELRDPEAYERKLSDFAETVQRARAPDLTTTLATQAFA